eukprot:109346_1
MTTLTKQFENIIKLKDEEIKKLQILIEQEKNNSIHIKNKNQQLNKENIKLNNNVFELKQKNKQLIKHNQQLEYQIQQLNNENQNLREQIKEMIIISNESNESNSNNSNKNIDIDIQPINDEKEQPINDQVLNNIRTKLANYDENGTLITKHESQNSMTAIVDLVKKTKSNMENIEKNKNIFLLTPNSNNISSDNDDSITNDISSDEPPLFWNNNDDIQNDRSILQRMISNPNEVLNNVISPTEKNNINNIFDNSLSDWDKTTNSNHSNDSNNSNNQIKIENDQKQIEKSIKKPKKQIKKKRKKSIHINDKKYNKKRRSKKLDTHELLFQNKNNST